MVEPAQLPKCDIYMHCTLKEERAAILCHLIFVHFHLTPGMYARRKERFRQVFGGSHHSASNVPHVRDAVGSLSGRVVVGGFKKLLYSSRVRCSW